MVEYSILLRHIREKRVHFALLPRGLTFLIDYLLTLQMDFLVLGNGNRPEVDFLSFFFLPSD